MKNIGKGIPIYEIGHSGPEHYITYHRVFRKSKAKKLFQQVRLELLNNARHMLDADKRNARKVVKQGYLDYDKNKTPLHKDTLAHYTNIAEHGEELWVRMVKSLREKDPDKIDNYPHDTPFLNKEHIKF